MAIQFNQEELDQVSKIKRKYPKQQAALMPLLWMAQKKFGWISNDVMKYLAELLDLPYSHVYGVATFYTMYFKKPMGKYHIQVCTNVSCMLRGGEEIFKQLCEKLGLSHNEVTEDGIFSIEEVECMGACGGAPMVAINEVYHENISYSQVESMIEELKLNN